MISYEYIIVGTIPDSVGHAGLSRVGDGYLCAGTFARKTLNPQDTASTPPTLPFRHARTGVISDAIYYYDIMVLETSDLPVSRAGYLNNILKRPPAGPTHEVHDGIRGTFRTNYRLGGGEGAF